MKIKKTVSIVSIVVILLVAASIFAYISGQSKNTNNVNAQDSTYIFTSENGEEVSVFFDIENDRAIFSGLGYDEVILPIAISASGARYENTDLGLVVWNKGDELTVLVDDEIIFNGEIINEDQSAVTETPIDSDENTLPLDAVVSGQSELDGKTFQLSSYNGEEISGDQSYTLAFEDGNIHAKFCNVLNGSYVSEGTSIKSANMISTMMYCEVPENLMNAENNFSGAMREGTDFTLENDVLTLVNKDGGNMVFTALLD